MFTTSHALHEAWPPLAWVATLRAHGAEGVPHAHIDHGRGVEWREHWFGEAVWPGDFAAGDIDAGLPLYGSAGRFHEDGIVFVPSWSNVDRLAFQSTGGMAWVSNSLPALCAITGARPLPSYPFAYRDIDSQKFAPGRTPLDMPSTLGPISFSVAEHLVWSGRELARRPWPIDEPAFHDFDEYYRYVRGILERMAVNMLDPRRSYPFSFATSLSNGYDSTTAATLGAVVGARRAFSFVEGVPDSEERLRRVASTLGLELHLTSRYAFRRGHLPEVPFLASGAYGYEAPFGAFREALANTVLLTGYFGDRMWGYEYKPLLPMQRRSQSGLSHTEFRLHAGYIHLPVAYLGCTQVERVHAVSLSDEMAPWRLDTPTYDRPVARRIVEEAGVPRGSFATTKLQSSVAPRNRNSLLHGASGRDFRAYLARARALGLVPSRLRTGVAHAVRRVMFRLGSAGVRLLEPLRYRWREPYRFVARMRAYGREDYLFKYSFGWALEHAVASYPALERPRDTAPAPGARVARPAGVEAEGQAPRDVTAPAMRGDA